MVRVMRMSDDVKGLFVVRAVGKMALATLLIVYTTFLLVELVPELFRHDLDHNA